MVKKRCEAEFVAFSNKALLPGVRIGPMTIDQQRKNASEFAEPEGLASRV